MQSADAALPRNYCDSEGCTEQELRFSKGSSARPDLFADLTALSSDVREKGSAVWLAASDKNSNKRWARCTLTLESTPRSSTSGELLTSQYLPTMEQV